MSQMGVKKFQVLNGYKKYSDVKWMKINLGVKWV